MSKVYESVTGEIVNTKNIVSTKSMKSVLDNDNTIIGDDVRGDLNIIINAMADFRKTIKDTFESKDITGFWESNMNILLELYKESFDVNIYNFGKGLNGYSYEEVPSVPFN